MNNIKSRIIKTANVKWRDLKFIQQDNFKEWIDNGNQKLVDSILKYQFADPFKVWQDGDILYCLDGKHRTLDLEQISSLPGITVPEELPATFIDCKDKKDAAELVLVYSSQYAKITQQGLIDFTEEFDIDVLDLNEISLPDLELGVLVDDDIPFPKDLVAPKKNNPPTIKLTFENSKQSKKFENELKLILDKKEYESVVYSISEGEV